MDRNVDIISITMDMLDECLRAEKLFQPFNSTHEGYAVLKEELEELWELIKRDKVGDEPDLYRKEAIQIGAMAIRFIADCLANGKVKRGTVGSSSLCGE